jgi:RNA polymerase sigma factor (TIGR02999 family)
MGDITQLLEEAASGEPDAGRRLFALVYDQLKAIAHGVSRQSSGNQLGTTGLVHECYLRLASGSDAKNRGHFYALAARAMRQILCDQARRRLSGRRGHGVEAMSDFEDVPDQRPQAEELVALDQLFSKLAEGDVRAARAMECRVFGGFSVAETAEALGVSERTAFLDLSRAREWLEAQLSSRHG